MTASTTTTAAVQLDITNGSVFERTLEQRLKFDHGLTINRTHLVELTLHGVHKRLAVVTISARGIVKLLPKPREDQMYSSWERVKGNDLESVGGVFVWPTRNIEHMAMFCGEPVATIPVKPSATSLQLPASL